jgi:hypothetical protein
VYTQRLLMPLSFTLRLVLHCCDSCLFSSFTQFLLYYFSLLTMSQPESTSTFLSPSKDESPEKKRLKIDYAQLIGPSFVRLQALGFVGLPKSKLDFRFIDTADGSSISESVRTILKNKKASSKLKFTPREVKKGNGPKTSYGYMSGTHVHLRCSHNLAYVNRCTECHSTASNTPAFLTLVSVWQIAFSLSGSTISML